MKFGSTLYLMHSYNCHRRPYIRQHFRQIRRLLTEITKQDPSVRSLTLCIRDENVPVVCEAVQALCQFDSTTHMNKTPSLALKLGHTLKACANTAISCAMQTPGNEEDTLKTYP